MSVEDVDVTGDKLPVNVSSDTPQDVKNVLVKFKAIVGDSVVSGPIVPTKSSSEILLELFSAFNAEPPTIPDNFQDVEASSFTSSFARGDLCDNAKVHKKLKTPKVGTKHRHKDKKHKRKKKGNKEHRSEYDLSSCDKVKPSSLLKNIKKERESVTSLSEDPSSKVTSVRHDAVTCRPPALSHIKQEKVKKRPTKSHCKRTLFGSDSGLVRSVRFNHRSKDLVSCGLKGLSIKISNEVISDKDSSAGTELMCQSQEPLAPSGLCTNETNKLTNSSLLHVDQNEHENITHKIKVEPGTNPTEEQPSISESNKERNVTIGQPKTSAKISIKSLKFSSVFEATVREIEEQAKAKADKYEEGEISNSDSDELVLSPISSVESDGNQSVNSTNSFYNTSQEIPRPKKIKRRHHSARDNRCSKHYHLSKCRKKSRTERDQVKIKKERHKRQHSLDTIEKYKKSRSLSQSPECRFGRDGSKNTSTLLKKSPLKSIERKNNEVSSFSRKKTVEELTDFCKQLSRNEHFGIHSSGSEGNNDYDSNSETEKPFRHPFQVKERPQSIIVNIKNSIQLPVRSFQEKAAEQSKQLRVQFPVSSGQRHRKAEDEWVPVSPKRDTPVKHTNTDLMTSCRPRPKSVSVRPRHTTNLKDVSIANTVTASTLGVCIAPAKDIDSIVTQKLRAMRTLQENPNSVEALSAMFRANQDMIHWAEAKQNQDQSSTNGCATAGAGTIAVSSTVPHFTAPAVASSSGVGMGMSLLQKMGWKPGEGLGKNREGVLEPLRLEVKMDKKGLVTAEDLKPVSHHSENITRPNTVEPRIANTKSKCAVLNVVPNTTKHPVNQLVELCVRNRWRGPQFELCHESGPDHRKNFLFKVLVNGTEYKPMVTSLTKKQAKTEAASICLQALRDLRT